MANDISIKLAVEGEKTFQSAIKAANSQIKAMDSELKAAMSGMSSMTTSEEKAAAKTKILTQQISANQEKLALLNKQYAAAKEQLNTLGTALETAKAKEGDNTEEVNAAARAYNNQAAKVADLERKIADTNTTINNETKELDKLNNKLAQTGQKMQGVGAKVSDVGKAVSSAGGAMTKYLTTPVLAAGAAAVKTASDFDTSMSKVQALSGATGAELDKLSNKAREMGESTKFTAAEAADAMGYMALAGWETEEMLSGINGILQLAAASEMDLANASDIVTDNLSAFGLAAKDSTMLADKMAYAMSSSNTSTEQLGEAYKNCAATATQLGYGLDDVTGALMVMADGGIKGGEAGTALASILTRLGNNVSGCRDELEKYGIEVYDDAGKVNSLSNILSGMKQVWSGLTDEQKSNLAYTVAGKTAQSELMTVLGESTGSFETYTEGLKNCSGAAEDMAEIMQDNLAGQITILKSKAQELGISFGEQLMPTIMDLVDGAQGLVDKLNSLDDETRESIIQVGLFAAAIGPATKATGKLTEGLGGLISKAGGVASAMSGGSGLGAALKSTLGMGGTVGLAVAGVAALTAAGIGLCTALYNATDPVKQINKHLEELGEAQERLAGAENVVELCSRYEELRERTRDASLTSEELAAAQEELAEVRAALSEATDGAVSAEGEYNDALDLTVETQKELAKAEKERSNIDVYTELVKGSKDYKKALEDQKEKQQKLADADADVKKATDRLSSATAKSTKEFQKNGKVSRSTSIELDDAATCAKGATDTYNDLAAELAESEAATKEYEDALIGLIRDGFLPAADGATLLGTSEDALVRKMNASWLETHEVKDTTQELAEEHLEAAEAAKEQAQAEDEVTQSLGEIGTSALEAITSGKNLRDTYDELKKEMDGLEESGDAETRMLAEQALAKLNLAATNQELAAAYVDLGVSIGDSLTSMSEFLISAGVTADEFASGVTSVRDSVVNDFKLIADENEITADKMVENLQANLKTQQEWSKNMSILWDQAYADENVAVMEYINYLASMGPEYASVVAEFANGGYSKLEEAAAAWSGIGEQSASDYASGIWMQQYVAEKAGAGVTDKAIEGACSVDASPAGENIASGVASGVASSEQQVADAAKDLALTAHSAVASIGWSDLGDAIATGISNGISKGSAQVASAAESAAKGIDRNKFKTAGTESGTAFINGLKGKQSTFKSTAQSLANVVTSAWTANNAKFKASGTAAGTQLDTGLKSKTATMKSTAGTQISGVLSAWNGAAGQFRTAGTSAASSLANGIGAGKGTVSSAASNVIYGAKSAMQIGGWYSLGYNISSGVASGVRGGSYLISSAARNAAQSALYAAKRSLGIHSPSSVFRDEVGLMIGEGFALGISDAERSVKAAVNRLGDTAAGALTGNMLTAPSWMSGSTSQSNSYTTIPATINIYAQPGQNETQIADLVAQRLEHMVKQKAGAI